MHPGGDKLYKDMKKPLVPEYEEKSGTICVKVFNLPKYEDRTPKTTGEVSILRGVEIKVGFNFHGFC